MCVFPRGFSKCIAGDSLLFTDEGIKEIGEYFDYQDNDIETYTEHDIGVVNKHGEIEHSDKGVYSGYRDTKVVRTEEGYEIEGTENHPLLVMKEDGVLDWVNIEDIEIGDFLAINRNNDIWGAEELKPTSHLLDIGNVPIPQNVLQSKKDIVIDYVNSLYEKIGIEGIYGYAFICNSDKLSKQLQIIMLNFGIIAHREKIAEQTYSLTINKDKIGKHTSDSVEEEYYYSKVEDIIDSKNHVYDLLFH